MKKKLRKWHIITLVIFATLLYVAIQNIWIFNEKMIASDSYEIYLIDTEWIMDDGSRWVFSENNELLLIIDGMPELNRKYIWYLEGNRFGFSRSLDPRSLLFLSKIQYITENNMQMWANGSIMQKINFVKNEY